MVVVMNPICARATASVTELKRNFSNVFRILAEGGSIAVIKRNRPEAYILSAEHYERLLEYIEDLEDSRVVLERMNEPSIPVDINDLHLQIDESEDPA
jgi:antitoxin StbD